MTASLKRYRSKPNARRTRGSLISEVFALAQLLETTARQPITYPRAATRGVRPATPASFGRVRCE